MKGQELLLREVLRAPLIRFFIWFASGIFIHIAFPFSIFNTTFISISAAFLALYIFGIWANKRFQKVIINQNLIVPILIAICSYSATYLQTEINFDSHYSKSINADKLLVELQTFPEIKEKSIKLNAEVLLTFEDKKRTKARGKILLYFPKNDTTTNLKPGDKLLIPAKYIEIPGPQNEEEFNFKKFLSYKQIYHEIFMHNLPFKLVDSNENPYRFIGLRIQNKLSSIISGSMTDSGAIAVCEALLIGNKKDLSKEMMYSYANTGAIHVLAVSGLHVGIIYLFINTLLSFIPWFKRNESKKAYFTVPLLWFYALLTGFSPSVLRATTMFSLLSVGRLIGGKVNIYNNLAGSAIILTAFNPYIITEIGFQLSYLAVIGIVFLQPKIQALLTFKSKIANYIWSISAVSIAAQITTFPLSLLIYHQFPVYFLLSNLFVIPISFLILLTGVPSLLLSLAFPEFSIYLFKPTEWLTIFINKSVRFLEIMPGSLVQNIYISDWVAILIYLSILFFFLHNKVKNALLIACILLSFPFCISIYSIFQSSKKNEFLAFAVPKSSVYLYKKGLNGILIIDSNFVKQIEPYKFHVRPYILKNYIQITDTIFINRHIKSINLNDLEINLKADTTESKSNKKQIILLGSNTYLPKDMNAKNAIIIFDKSNKEFKFKYLDTVNNTIINLYQSGFYKINYD